jgi:RNA polymerase sigma factor (sigma-70 family)
LYLRKMAVNVFLTWRRRWYQRTVRPESQPDQGGEVADPTGRIADRAELATLLARLSRQQRVAIVLRFFEDWDDADIAEVLGCTQGTVRGYISRGLAALRIHIREDPDYVPTEEIPT